MSIIILLISASLLVAGGFLFAFLWAVRSGQYDDPVSPASRILMDDDSLLSESKTVTSEGDPTS